MGGPGSGGHNRIPLDEHIRRGTFRPARHGVRRHPEPPRLDKLEPWQRTLAEEAEEMMKLATDNPNEREAKLLPTLEQKLDAAMRALDPLILDEGDRRIDQGEEPSGIWSVIEGDELVFRWAGFEILRMRRGALGLS